MMNVHKYKQTRLSESLQSHNPSTRVHILSLNTLKLKGPLNSSHNNKAQILDSTRRLLVSANLKKLIRSNNNEDDQRR